MYTSDAFHRTYLRVGQSSRAYLQMHSDLKLLYHPNGAAVLLPALSLFLRKEPVLKPSTTSLCVPPDFHNFLYIHPSVSLRLLCSSSTSLLWFLKVKLLLSPGSLVGMSETPNLSTYVAYFPVSCYFLPTPTLVILLIVNGTFSILSVFTSHAPLLSSLHRKGSMRYISLLIIHRNRHQRDSSHFVHAATFSTSKDTWYRVVLSRHGPMRNTDTEWCSQRR